MRVRRRPLPMVMPLSASIWGNRTDYARRPRSQAALIMEWLESRELLATITVTDASDAGPGTLRDALAVAASGDTINFNLPTGVNTIALTSELPSVGLPLTIDGGTPENTGARAVEINGSAIATPGANGFSVTAGATTIKNLAINGFSGAAVILSAGSGNTIVGNFLGTDRAGNSASPNGVGLSISGSAGNNVGGTTTELRNVISGNAQAGILLNGSGATNNGIIGNAIGIGADGTTSVGNGIGILAQGGAISNTVGGIASGSTNIIANNTGDGVQVDGATRIGIRGNSLFSNGGLGINLVNGGNNDQPFPVLTAVETRGTTTTIKGTLAAAASTLYNVDFYSNTAANPSGFGEGRAYIGSASVTTDGTGNATFQVNANSTVAVNAPVSATATDPNGNTSEFALNQNNTVPAVNLGITIAATPNPVAVSGNLVYTINVNNTGPSDATNVVVTQTLPSGQAFIGAVLSTNDTTVNGNSLQFKLGTIPINGTQTIKVTATVGTAGAQASTVQVTSAETDPNQGNNSANVSVTAQLGVDLKVETSVSPQTGLINNQLAFLVVVTNTTTARPATNVTLTDVLPSGVTFVTASATRGTVTESAGTVTAQLGGLTGGSSVRITIVVTPTVAGTLTNTATAASTELDSFPLNNVSVATPTVLSALPDPPNPGQVGGPEVLDVSRTGVHPPGNKLYVTFSQPLNSARATRRAAYRLKTAGADGEFGTRDDRVIPIRRPILDNPALLFLRAAHPIPPRQAVQLTIKGTGPNAVTNTVGTALNGSGQNGTDYVAVIPGVVQSSRNQRRRG